MEPPNESGLDACKNVEPEPAKNSPEATDGCIASATEPQNITSGKRLTALVHFAHVAAPCTETVQYCARCGVPLWCGPPFATAGTVLYAHTEWSAGTNCPMLVISDRPPKSRFIVPCYDGRF